MHFPISFFFFCCVERVAELELALKDSEAQDEEVQRVIAQWQETCTALEEKNAELVRSQESSGGDEGGISNDAFNALQAKLEETEKALADARDTLGDDGDALLQWQGATHLYFFSTVFPTLLVD